jgi:hypothetical protein
MASSVRAYRETFAKELKSFLKELIRVFPDDRDIKMISSTLNIAMMDESNDDSQDVARRLYDALAPYDDLIHARDPEFFTKAQKYDDDVPLFSKLNYYWQNLAAENRTCVWDYIHVLFHLSKKIFVQNE